MKKNKLLTNFINKTYVLSLVTLFIGYSILKAQEKTTTEPKENIEVTKALAQDNEKNQASQNAKNKEEHPIKTMWEKVKEGVNNMFNKTNETGKELKEEAKIKVHNLAEKTKASAEHAKEEAESMWEQAKEAMSKFWDKLKYYSRKAWDSTLGKISQANENNENKSTENKEQK